MELPGIEHWPLGEKTSANAPSHDADKILVHTSQNTHQGQITKINRSILSQQTFTVVCGNERKNVDVM
jgi:hypothetical protein